MQTGLAKLLGTDVVIKGDKYFSGQGTDEKPLVGDIRVWYEEVPLSEVSVLSSQKGAELTEFKTSDGSNFKLVSEGKVSAQDMLGKASAGAGDTAKIVASLAVPVIFVGLLVFAWGFKNARNQYILNKAMSGFKKA